MNASEDMKDAVVLPATAPPAEGDEFPVFDKEDEKGSKQGSRSSADSDVNSVTLELAQAEGQAVGHDKPEEVALNVDLEDDQPPAYHTDPPPPYRPGPAQIKKTIEQAKQESSGNVDFVRRVFFGICCGTICCGFMIALHLAIPVAMIAIGSMYLKQCPRQKYIPIYLVVGGCFGVAKAIINIVDQARKKVLAKKKASGAHTAAQKPNPADGIVSCFLTAWFIAGCYWIYSIHGDYQWTDSEAEDYCHQTLYLFAFWLTTVSFILIGLALCCCCAVIIGMCVVAKKTTV